MIEMVYNRTQADIDNNTEIAFIDYADLNRIESATKYVLEEIKKTRYDIVDFLPKIDWTASDIRTVADVERIKANVQTLRDFLPLAEDTPEVPDKLFGDYIKANNTERILNDVMVAVEALLSGLTHLPLELGKESIKAARH